MNGDVTAAIIGGLILGGFLGWAGTYITLTERHDQEIRRGLIERGFVTYEVKPVELRPFLDGRCFVADGRLMCK